MGGAAAPGRDGPPTFEKARNDDLLQRVLRAVA
jgi:hypothetical protein